jgi:hypothetical protein
MKSSWKALAWSAAGFAALAALVWMGSFLYWHVRITRAIASWEKELPARRAFSSGRYYSVPADVARVMYSAGCRGFPYVVAALDRSDGNPEFQESLMRYLVPALCGPGPYSDETTRVLSERSQRWEFIAEGLDFERREKLADFKAWWQENGHKYHRGWRTWSRWCYEE